ncbi:MAG TPA: PEP-CTERM sorting domain-containing protein [Candidatus Paceibacterota bacterium]|nr:PEP-CTERM sorting domain-containing protein [Candidatus Paceibacterota bacterium]
MLKIRNRMRKLEVVCGSIAFATLGVLPCAFGSVYSFEDATSGPWNAVDRGGTTSVNTDRASDGSYSFANVFQVPANFAGWTVNGLFSTYAPTVMNATATSISVDVYKDWSNPNGWGVYGNDMRLVFNNNHGWNAVSPTSSTPAAGGFTTYTFDVTPYAANAVDPLNSYSGLDIAWFVGTWADNGQPNGTATIAVDNIVITQSVPEPSSFALLGLGSLGMMIYRRRAVR